MAEETVPSVGGYTALTTATTAQNKTDINANLSKMLALFQQEGVNNTPVFPDLAMCPQSVATRIRSEILALQAIITASP